MEGFKQPTSTGANMSKLSFRIRSCTSEEPSNPVQELLMQSPQSKGWQSARFCDYPQEIVFQFMSPIRLRQLQFLSHQSKISSKVEIFVYMPDQNTPFINTEFKYRKLGYLSLDSNEKTGFQSRELKSVYVDSPCIYMKLLFHKQHNNKYNMFNQVGLIALSCFGDVLSSQPEKIEAPKEFYNQIQYQTQLDNITLDRLRTLEGAKERAVQNEDFEEAKRLKEAIERLKQVGSKLRQLDERKQVAISNEDYESAKIIKAEIERLRNAVAPEYLVQRPAPLQYNPKIPFNPQQFDGLQQDNDGGDNWNNQPMSKPSAANGSQKNLPPTQLEEISINNQENFNSNNVNPGMLEQSKQDKIQQQQFQDQFSVKNRTVNNVQNHDEMVLPAMKNQTNKKPWEQEDAFASEGNNNNNTNTGGQAQEVEKMSAENRKLADPLIPVIGEECAGKIFSKNWQVREEGLKWLEGEVQNPRAIQAGDPQGIFTAIVGVCSATLSDKVVQVSQASMSLLQALCTARCAVPTSLKGETGGYVDNCLASLIEMSGNHVPRVREAAEASFFSLGKVNIVGNSMVVQSISRGAGVKPKILSSLKHIVGRLNILNQFVQRFQIGKKDVPLQPVMEFAAKSVTHPNNEVRSAAIALITESSQSVGAAQIEPYLSSLPEQQRELVLTEIQNAGGGNKTISAPSAKESKKMVISTNIQAQGARQDESKGKKATKGGAAKNQSKQNDNEDQSNKICEFCNKFSQDFADKDNMDMHLWRECPMLLTCAHCAQVIEISSYATHLLEECPEQKKFRKCPRCKEPVQVSEYNDHVQENACIPAKPISVANRCPLCHRDIEQGPEGWRKHLAVTGCPNNERTAG